MGIRVSWKQLLKHIVTACVIIFFASMIGVILLCLVYLIPNQYIEQTRSEMAEIMDFETPKWIDTRFFSYAYGSKNVPDTFVYQLAAENESESLFVRIMGGRDEGDNRYWDGFMVIIRPMMIVFSYGQIRYFFTLIDMMLIWYIVVKSNERLHRNVSFAFMIGLVLINMHVNFYSIMLNMIFLVTFFFMAYFLKFYTKNMPLEKVFYIFLINGILTTYLDRYTASLLSLEMPLLMIVLLNIHSMKESSLRENLYIVLNAVVGWGLGFSLFWFNKWAVASLILKKNVFQSAFNQAQRRAMTNASEMLEYDVEKTGGRGFTILKNLASLLPTHGEHLLSLAIVLIIIVISMCVMMIRRKAKLTYPLVYLPVLLLMVMPYVYYFVFSNLNQIHATFYMYRMQFPVIVGGLVLYFESLNMEGETGNGKQL